MNDYTIENVFDPELYVTIPNHTSYEINCQGQIRNKETGKYKKSPKINKIGYRYVNIEQEIKPLHYWVLNSFVPCPDEDLYEVNHIDSVRCNCELSNLEWITHKENCSTDHCVLFKKIHAGRKPKPIIAINMETNISCEYNSVTQASKKLKIWPNYIFNSFKFDIPVKGYKFIYK